jgi:septation ring formation regulator EzrA
LPTENDSLVARVQSSYRKLSEVAADLNKVSDSLGQMIADLDSALKKLNLGLTVWVQFRGNDDTETLDYWSDELGYVKSGGKWGVALRTVQGNYNHPDRDFTETWLFNDGPRQLRLASIPYIPQLLEKLSEHAANTTKQISEKLETTQELINAVKEAAAEPKSESLVRERPTGGGQKR